MPATEWRDQCWQAAELGSEEIAQALRFGRGVPLSSVLRVPVHEEIAAAARRHPDRIAIKSIKDAISYATLDAWAEQIAFDLSARGVDKASHVGVFVEPSAAMVAAVLGVLRSGAVYVPLDEAQPDSRISSVVADAGAVAIVASDKTRPRLESIGLPLVMAGREDIGASPTRAEGLRERRVHPDDAAYLIYTSGSSGEPKGVLVGHDQLSASTMARRMVYRGSPVFLLVSPLAFDSSVAGIFGTLTAGGTLAVADQDEVRDPERLLDLIHEHAVTQLLCVPSLYQVLLDAAERREPGRLRSLQSVIVAGEPLTPSLVERHFALLRTATLFNEYGPTEATVWASYERFDSDAPVTIGGPAPGVQLYLLDEQLRPVPIGAEGELFIAGAGVARGYFGRPEATARAFLDDPFAAEGSGRMYRTGDRARWDFGGKLHCLGRLDHQVKVRGYRVELNAVEAALTTHAGVHEAAAVTDSTACSLVAFVVALPQTSLEELRQHLAAHLPAAMVPARIFPIDQLPRGINGKVDRVALRRRAEEKLAVPPSEPHLAAEDTVTRRVIAAWSELLKLDHVPLDGNFFDLGGHSLLMFELQDALERQTGVRLSVVELFQHTTASAQSAVIRAGASGGVASLEGRIEAVREARILRTRRQRSG
jgi:amino acid adenylation domain-containing protein